MLGTRRLDVLSESLKAVVRKLERVGSAKLNLLSDHVKDELRELGIIVDGILVPPLIQMWMCFTNKNGEAESFDDKWFEVFTEDDVCGKPLLSTQLKHTPVSKGLAHHFIMRQDREMEYPFVKRSRVTQAVPEDFPEMYTKRMYKIMGYFGTRHGQHLVSQQQIYAGGAVVENGKYGITAYSWRDQALAMSHDSFYSQGVFHPHAQEKAEQWQDKNDELLIEENGFADADMRMFAYTFGNRMLDDVWTYYYDSREKYDRLRRIKGALDPNGLFSADQFSLRPL